MNRVGLVPGSSPAAPEREGSVQGVQQGSDNTQQNYFAPVAQYLFSGAFERLRDVFIDPMPLTRDLDLERFTGREWLISKIDGFIENRPRGYVIIQAEAGVGKSTLAAHLARTRQWLCHFTRLGGRSPEVARKNLAAQLIAQWDLSEWIPGGVLPASSSRPDWFAQVLDAAARKRDRLEPDEKLRAPIVMLVDGLDEAEPEPGGIGKPGLPLGLPWSLPDGVFVIATSRFGIDRALHAVRNPADWLQIEVEGADNLEDMRQFLRYVTSPGGDAELMSKLRGGGVDVEWFRVNVARACAGIWIYLRYVLDEIRAGERSPRSVGHLPSDLAAFYAEQVDMWRGVPDDEAAQRRWERVRLPLLGVLGAARGPLPVAQLATFGGGLSPEATRVFIEETIRAFLSRREDLAGTPCYALRHQSLRDLLTGNVPSRPDLESAARMLGAQVQVAHGQIARALIPPGAPGERDWTGSAAYARQHLAVHAAANGEFDALATDPGFLAAADPRAVLAQRARLRTPDGRRAMAAFDLCLDDWDAATFQARMGRLSANAARVRATALSAACEISGGEWPILWAAWAGQGHRKLLGHEDAVNSVAIGRAGDRDVIISGSGDATVRIWDAVTGDLIGTPLIGHDSPVRGVAIGRAGDRDVIISGSGDATVRIWDAVTGDLIGTPLGGYGDAVNAVAIGQTGNDDVIIYGSDDGKVRIRDAITGELIHIRIADYNSRVDTVGIGQVDGRTVIIAATKNGGVQIWGAITMTPVRAIRSNLGDWVSTAVAAIGRAGGRDVIVASSDSDDAQVQVWDAVTGDPVLSLEPVYDWPSAMAIGRAGDRDIIACADGPLVRVWDAATGSLMGIPFADHEGSVHAVGIGRAADRDIIVSGSSDRTVRVWDAVASDPARDPASLPLNGHDGPVLGVAIGRAGDRDIIASGARDETIRIWDAATGDPIDKLHDDLKDGVNTVAVGRAGRRDIIISGAGNGMVRTWDAVTRESLLSADHDSTVNAVAVGWAGHRDIIISGAANGTLRIWDAVTGDLIDTLITGFDFGVNSVAIGRAGGRDIIISGSGDAKVRVWDAVTGGILRHFDHDTAVNSVAIGWAGDRDIIISGSNDATVRIWDALTGELVGSPLTGHDSRVNAVATGRVGEHHVIISGSNDRSILVRRHYPRR